MSDDIVTFGFQLPRDEFQHLLDLAEVLDRQGLANNYLRTLIQRAWDAHHYLVARMQKEKSGP